MTRLDIAELTARQRYLFAIGAVVPRPIAWLSTMSTAGQANLAPFSFFTVLSASPLYFGVGIGHREPVKDTLRNLREQGEAVLHIVPPALLEPMHASGAEYASAIDEAEELGLETVESYAVQPRRLAQASVAFECRFDREIAFGAGPTMLCVLEGLQAHVRDELLDEDGLPDSDLMRAPGRLGSSRHQRAYLTGDDWDVVNLGGVKPPPGKGL